MQTLLPRCFTDLCSPAARRWLPIGRGSSGLVWILALVLTTVLWLPPSPAQAQSGNQWRVDYYPNLNWAGAPVYTEYANVLSFNWGISPPGPNMPASNWTARASSIAFFYAGLYRFTVVADDEFTLSIDGVDYYSTVGQGQAGKAIVVDIAFPQGTHVIQFDYRQYTGPGYLSVDWDYVKDANPVQPPAPSQPNPSSAASVVTRYGDYTRCIQQNLHQAACFQSDGQWSSPNLGSIQMEPPIVLWQNCKADEVRSLQLYANQPAQPAKCSKTEAGWFPS